MTKTSKTRISVMLSIIVTLAIVWWPVLYGEYVFDDITDFRVNAAWLTQGDAWKHYIFHGFHNWALYFRPLVVGMYVVEVRIFGATPMPMHAVSLGIHLSNTLLIGLIAWRCLRKAQCSDVTKQMWLVTSMLLYGLHPALIEPLSWIDCQFDLTVTLFMLLGLYASAMLTGRFARSIVVAVCFFFAACSKESAAVFPFMLATFDWALQGAENDNLTKDGRQIHKYILRNWYVYAALFVAGLLYLRLRYWAMGVSGPLLLDNSLSYFGRFQQSCFIYVRYWVMLLFSAPGLNPKHEFDPAVFELTSWHSWAIDLLAVATLATALFAALRRRSVLACLVLMVTVSLLPVLRLLPIHFDSDLFHERYLASGLAGFCAMLPLLHSDFAAGLKEHLGKLKLPLTFVAAVWIAFAVVDIRVTVPLYGNSVKLWTWALYANPNSNLVKEWLLSTYISENSTDEALHFGRQLLSDPKPCFACLLKLAIIEIEHGDVVYAKKALEIVRELPGVADSKKKMAQYRAIRGMLLVKEGRFVEAEAILRTASGELTYDYPLHLYIAYALAGQGRMKEAEDAALAANELAPGTGAQKSRRYQDVLLMLQSIRRQAVQLCASESSCKDITDD
ncbi:MAG TPA: hypothetical protein VLT92_00770 [Burkholderiales bacterium]|nr:hypothetical protein [Burkholderiales bacterium]